MTRDHAEALRRLTAALAEYEDECGTSVLDEPDIEPINPGHPVHSAVVEVEKHYGGRLPMEGRKTWKDLLRRSRAKQKEAWDLAGELLRWVKANDKRRSTSDSGQVGSAKLSPRELATKHGVAQRALQARLERWRYEHDAGYDQVSNPARNMPKYLYDESAIMPIIEALKAKSVAQKRVADVQ